MGNAKQNTIIFLLFLNVLYFRLSKIKLQTYIQTPDHENKTLQKYQEKTKRQKVSSSRHCFHVDIFFLSHYSILSFLSFRFVPPSTKNTNKYKIFMILERLYERNENIKK